MSSDRRSRSGVPPRRRPAEDANEEPRQPRRDPRRRTAYVPRQNTPRAGRPAQRGAPPERRTRPATDQPRYRPQQPPYRTRRPEPIDDFEEYDDAPYDEIEDDRLIEEDRSFSQPTRPREGTRRPSRAGVRPRRDPYQDALPEDEYFGDDDMYDEGYEDSFIDEDDWYEEEAAAGAYNPPRQRAPRQQRLMPRPSISMSRPNISRPVMPARIQQAALVQDQQALILAGVLVLSALILALLTMNRVDTLAPRFATHISASGIREAFQSEQALWQLPLMSAALLLMNLVAAWFLAQYSRFSSRLLLVTSVIVHVMIWVAFLRIAF